MSQLLILFSIMFFYALLTFFIFPYIGYLLMNKSKSGIIYGMIIGFIISIVLWISVGNKYVKMK
jgi:Na+/proline symporter